MQIVYAFVALGYATQLWDAGVPQTQARPAMAARDFIMAELVTKADLAATGDLLRTSMSAHESRMESQVAALGSRIDLLESRIDNLGLQLAVRIGALLAAAVAILTALQKLG